MLAELLQLRLAVTFANRPKTTPALHAMKEISVTCALIEQAGKVLVTQRSPTMPLPLLWEFPGGKVHDGETEEACLIREIQEELNLEIEPLQHLTPVVHYDGAKTIILIPFVCRIISGEIKLAEHTQSRWAYPANLMQFAWCPADLPIVEEYMRLRNLSESGFTG